MLFAAKRAGEALIEAKGQCAHGEFKPWVEANCRVSYSTAAVYMKVTREWDERSSTLDFSTASIRDFINNKKPKPVTPDHNLPDFTEDEAEYALKIAARMERSDFEGERQVAKEKRIIPSGLAAGKGMNQALIITESGLYKAVLRS